MARSDPAQSDTMTDPERGQMEQNTELKMGEKAVSEASNPPKTDHSPAQNGPPPVEPGAAKVTQVRTAVLMGTLCLAVFLSALDITIVSTALPTISDYYQSPSGYIWVGSGFLLPAAVVAPTWAKFSDIWGRKSILLIAIAVFFLGSTLCGAAVSISMLIVGRVIQGIAAGGMLSLVNIVVGDLFSQRDRGMYYGMVGMVWAVAFTLGPLIGGAFTENVSWRWCFYVNLPISGTAFFIVLLLLKLETPKTSLLSGIKAIDWIGTLTLVGGLLMFLLGLSFGGTTYSWDSPAVICLIVFGIVAIGLFFIVERYVAYSPIVPIHLYSNTSNFAIILVNLCHGIVFTSCTYFLPLYCQSVLGSSPLLSGVLLLPFAGAMSIAAVGSGVYLKKTGRFLDCIRGGVVLLVLGIGLFYDLPDGKYWPKIVLYQLVAGFGVGLLFQPPMIALQNNVPAQDNAAATASFGLVRSLASAIGVVLGNVAFSNKMNDQYDSIIDALGASAAIRFSGANAQASILTIASLSRLQQQVVDDAFYTSIKDIWIVAVCFAAVGLFVCLLIRHKKLEKTHVEVKTGLAGEAERRKILLEQRKRRQANGDPSEQDMIPLNGEAA